MLFNIIKISKYCSAICYFLFFSNPYDISAFFRIPYCFLCTLFYVAGILISKPVGIKFIGVIAILFEFLSNLRQNTKPDFILQRDDYSKYF